jgi:hypothetical protein
MAGLPPGLHCPSDQVGMSHLDRSKTDQSADVKRLQVRYNEDGHRGPN